ncbi:MAG: hypothetical protein ACYTEU_05680 [Planctomycetota bacterium]|jgi:hypothetical protein
MDNLAMLTISDMLRILDRAKEEVSIEAQQEIVNLKISIILLHEEMRNLKTERQEIKQALARYKRDMGEVCP